MNIFYLVFIHPLETVYKAVYTTSVTFFRSYGFSIFVLSFCSSFAYLPLGRIASKMQEKERLMRGILKPQIDKINSQENDGSKKHERIAALYKRYRYHPIMVIRTAIGVLLQFPFLLAAYYMILHYTPLKGESFYVIKDLAKPDGLLWGFNFLPLLMTLVNFTATAISPGLEKKDRIQAIVIAIAFFFLLYTAPSALLLFWTTNNVIFLLQSLFLRFKTKPHQIRHSTHASLSTKKTLDWSKISSFVVPLFFSCLMTALFASLGIVVGIKKSIIGIEGISRLFKIGPEVLYVLYALVFYACIQIYLFKNKTVSLKKIFQQTIIWIPSAVLLAILVFTDKLFSFSILHIFFYTVTVFTSLLSIFLLFNKKKLEKKLDDFFNYKEALVYFVSVYIFATQIIFANPLSLIKSDISYFYTSVLKILAGLVPLYIILIAFFALLYAIKNSLYRKILSLSMLFLTLCTTLFSFLSSNSYGVLDYTIFAQPHFFDANPFVKDVFAVFLTFIIVCILSAKPLKKNIVGIVSFAALAFTIVPTIDAIHIHKKQAAQNQISVQNEKINKTQEFYALSKTEQNVVYFFWDMFTGGHMENILNRNPELKTLLDGFVWYPDTLAPSENTYLSTGSMMGGTDFLPEKINEKPGKLIIKFNDALLSMPNLFTQKGYKVAINTLPYLDSEYFLSKLANRDSVLLYSPPASDSAWKKKKPHTEASKIPQYESYLLNVSLFKMLPTQLRYFVYNDGQWLSSVTVFSKSTVNDVAQLKMFSEYTAASSQKPKLTIYYTMLSHMFWHLKEKELTICEDPYPQTLGQLELVDGILPEHLFTEEHMINMLIDYINTLKKEGIYDNTRIVIVSDHCNADSSMLNRKIDNKDGWSAFGRPHALLLFKDFNSTGNLQIKPDFMTSTDAYYLAGKDIFFTQNDFPDNSIRTHRVGSWSPNTQGRQQFEYTSKTVQGSIFSKDSWK